MDALENGNVRVRYDRNVPKEQTVNSMYSAAAHRAFPDLYRPDVAGAGPIKRQTAILLDQNRILFFVDGPRHDEKDDTIVGTAHYLCTPGGHPWPPSEARLATRLLVLSAWDVDPYRQALRHFKDDASMKKLRRNYMHGSESDESEEDESMEIEGDEALTDDEVFDFVYFYTGGRIREAVQIICGRETIQGFAADLRGKTGSVDMETAKLALTSTECSASVKSIDSFRSMFRPTPGNGAVFQIVDSQFILSLVGDKIATDEFLNSFKQAIEKNQRAVAGYHFEAMMHSVFCRNTPANNNPVQESLKATGNGAEGVKQLDRKFLYWIPSTSNFANIDAALVDEDGTLFCLQYTVQATHVFNETTFRAKFLRRIPNNFGARVGDDSARIIFVVPSDVAFTSPETFPV